MKDKMKAGRFSEGLGLDSACPPWVLNTSTT